MPKTFDEILDGVRDLVTVKRVYGKSYEKDGLIVIPAARVRGGGGGGSQKEDGSSNGGGGFGVTAQPAGAWIIKNGKVRWKPAVNLTAIVLGAQVVALAAILAREHARRAEFSPARRPRSTRRGRRG
jgi:uncharacterized spore protein YtfJ